MLLGLLHGLDYVASHFLVGAILFALLVLHLRSATTINRELRAIRVLAALTLVSSSLYMLISAADMMESWAVSDLWMGMSHSTFEHLWCIRILLLAGIFGFASGESLRKGKWVVLSGLALCALLVSSMSGHAGSQPTWTVARVALDWSHSLAIAAWTGGLFSLWRWLGTWLKRAETESSYLVVRRFSHLAMASTVWIGVSGLVMTYWAGVSLLRPWESEYGLLICGKITLFGAALAAAAINQFLHLRKFDPNREALFAKAIRREVTLELIFAILIFGVAGFLTRTMFPGSV